MSRDTMTSQPIYVSHPAGDGVLVFPGVGFPTSPIQTLLSLVRRRNSVSLVLICVMLLLRVLIIVGPTRWPWLGTVSETVYRRASFWNDRRHTARVLRTMGRSCGQRRHARSTLQKVSSVSQVSTWCSINTKPEYRVWHKEEYPTLVLITNF